MIPFALMVGSLLASPGVQVSAQQPETYQLVAEPSEVRAGMFYSGATIRVTADVPPGLGISISCVGEGGPLELKRKGKVLGLIWMSVGEVTFDPVPHLYLLATSPGLTEMAGPGALRSAGVGYEALEAQVRPEDTFLFQEAIRFKESDGLFGILGGDVRLMPQESGLVRAVAEFSLPAKAPEGEYRILLHGFKAEGGELLAETRVAVVQVGAAAFIYNLATAHGLAYGLFAVVVAVVVGLVTGVLFGLGSKKGH
jgi:uncharacterized protein (TIGR02186 family)